MSNNSSYAELMGKNPAGVDEATIAELSVYFVADAIEQHDKDTVWGKYEKRVEEGVCTPLEEVFDAEDCAIVYEFAADMARSGFRGAAAMNPPKKQVEPVAPAAPARSRHALTVQDVAEPELLAVGRLRAAFTGKADAGKVRPVVKEPSHGRTYPFGTTETHVVSEETGLVEGAPWTSGRPLPRMPVVVIRGNVVEVGTVRGALSVDGNIVADRTDTPLPIQPGQEIRLGVFGPVIPLTFMEQVEIPEEVRAILPEQPRGAIFRDAHGDVGVALATVAKRALQQRPTAAVLPAQREASVVAQRPFQGASTSVGGQAGGADILAATVAVEAELAETPATVNGGVPTQRDGKAAEATK